jgi:hypothetical protein
VCLQRGDAVDGGLAHALVAGLKGAAEAAPAPHRAGVVARIRAGRPGRLAARLLTAAAARTLAVLAVGWQPAALAVATGALTWLALTGSSDIVSPTGRRRS